MSTEPKEVPEELVEQMPTAMQAWAIEVKEHLDVLIEQGFTREEAMRFLLQGVQVGWFDGHSSCCLPASEDP